MQMRLWHRYEYAEGSHTRTRHHRHYVLQIGQRVFTLLHRVGRWTEA